MSKIPWEMAERFGPWVLVKEARNKHYRDAAPDSYESTMQRCFQIQGACGGFIADLILPVNNAEYVAELIVEACNKEILERIEP